MTALLETAAFLWHLLAWLLALGALVGKLLEKPGKEQP
jgi:hypothetical protein